MLPPPLAWIESYCKSISTALGQTVTYSCNVTVNPLVFSLKLSFRPELSGKNKMLAWNLFEIFAKTNESVPYGKTIENSNIWVLEIIAKRRLGPIRDEHPLGEVPNDNDRRIG